MIAQVLLSLLLAVVLLHGWSQIRRLPLVAWLSITTALVGGYFVWAPSRATALAELVGIGRGADLIFYVWVCISFNLLLSLHLKLRMQQETITKLARHIALTNAVIPSERALAMEAPPTVPGHRAGAHMSTQMPGRTV